MSRTSLRFVFPLLLITAFTAGTLRFAPERSRARSVAPSTAGLFISEYVEGATPNATTKAIEIYNGTASTIDLAANGFTIQVYSNGSPTPGTTIALLGTILSGEARVIATAPDGDPILPLVDQRTTQLQFNGDDAVALASPAGIVDVIGQIGTDPGTQWGTAPDDTLDVILRRELSVCTGDTNGADAFDPAIEWNGVNWTASYPDLGQHLDAGSCAASTDLSLSGSVLRPNGRGITGAQVTVSGGSLSQPVTVFTNRRGQYQVSPLTGSQTYTVTVSHPRYTFNPNSQSVQLAAASGAQNVNFTASP